MSTPNARVARIVSHSSVSSGGRHSNRVDSAITADAGKPKTVYASKNQFPIYIVQLAEVLEIAWRKKAGFDMLASSVGYLSSGHSMSDLITLVDNKVPMDTYSALQDAEKQMMKVMYSV